MIISGGIPNFSLTPSTSKVVLVMVLIKKVCSSTNCAISLSPVLIRVFTPILLACNAKVPITSSASTPGIVKIGKPIALITACNGSIWLRKSSGILGRLALYSPYISSRKVFPFASNTTTICVGLNCFNRLCSMLTTP